MLTWIFGGKKKLDDSKMHTLSFIEKHDVAADDESWKFSRTYRIWWTAEKLEGTDKYRLQKTLSQKDMDTAGRIPESVKKEHVLREWSHSKPVTARTGAKLLTKEDALLELKHLEDQADFCPEIHDVADRQPHSKSHFSAFLTEMGQDLDAPAIESKPESPMRFKPKQQKPSR